MAAGAISFTILLLVAFGWPTVRHGYTDFLSFYAGARLVGTPYLYSSEHVNEVQREYSEPEEIRAYIRPPFYAALLWPLGKLPYFHAHVLWQLLNVLALAGFIALWSPNLRGVLVCCWYFPIWINFILGQDIPFFLFLLSATAALLKKEKIFFAGLLFALCGVKFNLLFLLPLFILARRLWRFLGGVVAGAAIMLAISFTVQGWGWPAQYFDMLKANERLQASQHVMANFKGLLFGAPYAFFWVTIAGLGVAAGAWYVMRRSSAKYALAVMTAGGLLVSLHAYLPDCSLLLPLLLGFRDRADADRTILVSATTSGLTLTLIKPSIAFLGQLWIVIPFCLAVFEVYREGRSQAASPLGPG